MERGRVSIQRLSALPGARLRTLSADRADLIGPIQDISEDQVNLLLSFARRLCAVKPPGPSAEAVGMLSDRSSPAGSVLESGAVCQQRALEDFCTIGPDLSRPSVTTRSSGVFELRGRAPWLGSCRGR